MYILIRGPSCISSSLALYFSDYSFLVHHPFNHADRHILARAMASDFSVAWQQLEKYIYIINGYFSL
jgi:hypothetical protein